MTNDEYRAEQKQRREYGLRRRNAVRLARTLSRRDLMNEDKLLTLPEIADRLRWPENTVRYKRSLGELPFTFRLGRRVVAYESDVEAFIAAAKERA